MVNQLFWCWKACLHKDLFHQILLLLWFLWLNFINCLRKSFHLHTFLLIFGNFGEFNSLMDLRSIHKKLLILKWFLPHALPPIHRLPLGNSCGLLTLYILFHFFVILQVLQVLLLILGLLNQQFFVFHFEPDNLLLQFEKNSRIDHPLSSRCIDLILSRFVLWVKIIALGKHLLQIVF